MSDFICDCCGQKHTDWPALTFNSPSNYHRLSESDKQEIAELKSDTCIIVYPDQTDYFIRGTLFQQVNDSCQDLDYGLWVSLSKKSFEDYIQNFDNENYETQYFGWLCNFLPQYENTESIPTTVYTRQNNIRPEIVPHKSFDHPFVYDYYNGIQKENAEKRIKEMIINIQTPHDNNHHKKLWWKFW